MSFVDLKNICVSYDGKTNVLEGLNLEIQEGELVSLLGPSGCGKTTTLRVIAGYIETNSGDLLVDGQNYTKIPVHKRNFGIVFQSYALFPHMTVRDNVAFGLKMRKMDKETIRRKVDEMLEICGLTDFADRLPKQMSGGQRQRVALARALVIEPKLLLLDEPLSNLDAKLRLQMRVEIKRLQKRLGITTIFVTHDQEECFSISDRVAVMNGGVIEQYDTPERIYAHPDTEFVARFIGFENFIDVTNTGNCTWKKDTLTFKVDEESDKQTAKITIRPDDIEIVTEAADNCIKGTVQVRTFLGKSYQYEVSTDCGTLFVNGSEDHIYETGDELVLHLPSHKIVLV